MRTIDAQTLAALGDSETSGRVIDRGLIAFDLGTVYGFWTGVGPFTWNGITFTGAGSLIKVEAISSVSDGSAVPVRVTLTAIPNSDLSPDVLGTIEQFAYHLKPVIIYTAYFSADDHSLLSVELEYRGYIDQVRHYHSISGQDVLEFMLESKALDHRKTGYRTRSDADQRHIDSNDNSLRHAAVANLQEIFWGREVPTELRSIMGSRR